MVDRLGDRVWVIALIYDKDNNLFDPDSHTIKLIDPNGVTKVSSSNPTKNTTGNFTIALDVPSDGISGVWEVTWTIIVTGQGQKTERFPIQIYE